MSNNIAEYEGLIPGLKAASALGVKRLVIKGDSQLLVNFSNKVYEPKDEHMEAYLAEVRKMEKQFAGLELQHVPRGTNKEANDIAKRASKRQPQEPGVFKERLFKPSATPPLQARLSLGRSSRSPRPREPQLAAQPQELGYSWRSSPRSSAGPRSSRST